MSARTKTPAPGPVGAGQPRACIFCGWKLDEIHRHYHPPVPGWLMAVCVCAGCPTPSAEQRFLGSCGGTELLRAMRDAVRRQEKIEEAN